MRPRSKALILIIMALTAFATGCPERRSIADVNARPDKFEGKEVAIAGVVRESYGLSIPGTRMAGGVYKIDDGTGSIWVVVSDGNVPTKGAEIGVRGRISTGVSWNGRNYGLGLLEDERRYKKH